MRTKLMFAVLCVGGLALLASPALGQPRGRGGPEDGPRAVAADPTAREQAMEQQIRELQMQLKRLQEEVAGSESKPQAKPQAAEGVRQGPAFAARRAEAQPQPAEGRFQGRGSWVDGAPRGMREQAALAEARPGREGPAPSAGRFDGPAMRQGPRGPWMGQRPALGWGERRMHAGPQNVLAQVRQLLDEARTMIARAEQLLGQQAPRLEASRGPVQQRPNFRQDGRDGLQGPGGGDRFAPPGAGRDGRIGPGPMGYQGPGAGRQGAQDPIDGGPWQRGPGRGQGFRGGRGDPGGPSGDGAFGEPPGSRGEGRFGPPRPYED